MHSLKGKLPNVTLTKQKKKDFDLVKVRLTSDMKSSSGWISVKIIS